MRGFFRSWLEWLQGTETPSPETLQWFRKVQGDLRQFVALADMRSDLVLVMESPELNDPEPEDPARNRVREVIYGYRDAISQVLRIVDEVSIPPREDAPVLSSEIYRQGMDRLLQARTLIEPVSRDIPREFILVGGLYEAQRSTEEKACLYLSTLAHDLMRITYNYRPQPPPTRYCPW